MKDKIHSSPEDPQRVDFFNGEFEVSLEERIVRHSAGWVISFGEDQKDEDGVTFYDRETVVMPDGAGTPANMSKITRLLREAGEAYSRAKNKKSNAR